MLFSSLPGALKATDARLHPFLRARTDTEARWLLEAVLKDHIRPTCEVILHSRFAATADADSSADRHEDLEDVLNTALAAMAAKLYAMRQEYQAAHSIAKPMRDVRLYAAKTTFNVWREYLRKLKPVYHQVYRFTRSLLTNHKAKDNMPQLAAWEEAQGKGRKSQVGGLALWRDQKRPSACGDRLHALLQNPKASLAEACARQSDPLEISDYLSLEGLHVICAWLNHPVTLNHLTKVLCEATDRVDASPLPLEHGKDIPDPAPENDATAFMQMFWECARAKMTPRERAALLLGGKDPNGVSLLHWVLEVGMASHRELAEAMELPVHTLMDIWPRLPLSDKAIAETLGCTDQSVSIRRFHARAKLSKCLADDIPKIF